MDHREKTMGANPHQLIMQDRKSLEMTGVSDVENFDDTIVVVHTSLGELTVRGKELHVRQLNLDSGSLALDGQIDALSYNEISKGGFFGRLLR